MAALVPLAARLLRDRRFRALLVAAGPKVASEATRLAQQGRWRRLAVLHAETVVDGTFLHHLLDGEPHWVVWSGDETVAVYPPWEGDLDEALRHVDRSRRRRPAELPTRVARDRVGRARRLIGRATPSRRH